MISGLRAERMCGGGVVDVLLSCAEHQPSHYIFLNPIKWLCLIQMKSVIRTNIWKWVTVNNFKVLDTILGLSLEDLNFYIGIGSSLQKLEAYFLLIGASQFQQRWQSKDIICQALGQEKWDWKHLNEKYLFDCFCWINTSPESNESAQGWDMFMLLLQVFYVLPINFQCIHLIFSPFFCQDVLFQILQSSDQVKCEELTRRYNLEISSHWMLRSNLSTKEIPWLVSRFCRTVW